MPTDLCTVGVDTGLTGAISIDCGRLLCVYDIPVVPVKRGRTARMRVDAEALHRLSVHISLLGVDCICIEDVWGVRGQGAGPAFAFGEGAGRVPQAFTGAGVGPRIQLVSAQRRKAAMAVPADKSRALEMVRGMWPGHAHYFRRQKDHGRAESALIARYAQRLVKPRGAHITGATELRAM